jgi:hypothetical protein
MKKKKESTIGKNKKKILPAKLNHQEKSKNVLPHVLKLVNVVKACEVLQKIDTTDFMEKSHL